MKYPLTVTWLRPALISTEMGKKDVGKPRNGALTAIFGLGMLFAGSQALADDEEPLGQVTPNLRVTGELRARYEGTDYFQPNLNPKRGVTANQNDYSFGALRARLGVGFTSDYLDAFLQGQYTGPVSYTHLTLPTNREV